MNTQKKLLIFGLVLLLSLDLYALGWTGQQEKYIQRIWNIESGLPQNTIQTLIQTHDGYLWIGTPAGLARFDGVRFTVFTKQNTPALKNDNILALYEDTNQVLWIGTDGGGLYSYQNKIWHQYSRKEGLSNDHIKAIVADWRENLWIGTEYGLNRLSNEDIKVFTIDDGLLDNIITVLNIDNNGHLLVGTLQGGLARINKESVQIFDQKDGIGNQAISSIHIDSNNNTRIGTFNGIYLLDQSADLFTEIPGTYSIPITSLVETEQGSIWAGTMAEGILQFGKPGSGMVSLPDDYVCCILKDREGHIWIGTDTAGLIQIKVREVQAITRDQGLPENGVSTLMEDRRGNLWIGLRNKGLCKLSADGVLKEISVVPGLFNQGINALYEDLDGSIWCGTENNGLFRIQNDHYQHLTSKDGLSSNTVTSIFRNRERGLLIGTDKGLCSYHQGKIYQAEGFELKENRINILYEGVSHDFYAGTEAGLYWQTKTGWVTLDSALTIEILSLYEDEDMILWIGTNGQGLKIWKDNKIYTITESMGLCGDHILSISPDENDNLWMSTYNGVFQVDRTQILNQINDNHLSIYPVIYNEYDGMPNRQCSGNVYPAVWKTKNGKLLYPTVNGISIFSPKSMVDDLILPKVILEDLLVDNKSVGIDKALSPGFSGGKYEFYFTAIDYSGPEKLRFEYLLEGYDTKFKRLIPDRDRYISYEDLGAGVYNLLVKVSNHKGLQSQQASLIEFEVFTPFYAHPIFIMLVVMFLLTASSGIVYLRHQRVVSNQMEKYRTSRMDKEMTDRARDKIKSLMESEKVYLDPDLNLKDLSARLKIHSNYISRIINEQFKMSYNDYVNMYRIEDVKQKLSDPETSAKTVLEIMYETGFYSKSVFNTVLKNLPVSRLPNTAERTLRVHIFMTANLLSDSY